jgi:hypothetical protein
MIRDSIEMDSIREMDRWRPAPPLSAPAAQFFVLIPTYVRVAVFAFGSLASSKDLHLTLLVYVYMCHCWIACTCVDVIITPTYTTMTLLFLHPAASGFVLLSSLNICPTCFKRGAAKRCAACKVRYLLHQKLHVTT